MNKSVELVYRDGKNTGRATIQGYTTYAGIVYDIFKDNTYPFRMFGAGNYQIWEGRKKAYEIDIPQFTGSISNVEVTK